VDIPPAEVVSEFIKLERADATKVVEMLKEVFDKGTQPATPGVPGVPGAPVIPGVKGVRPVQPIVSAQQKEEIVSELGALTALSEDSIVVGKIKIAADVRTNRIHVITRPVNMRFIRKLIAEFDANVEFGKPVTRPLRYISAADILPVLVQALTEPGTNGQGPDSTGANTGANPVQPKPRSPSMNTSSGFDSSSSGGNSGGQNFSEELSTTAVDTTPKAVTIGNAKIISDQRANAIIVLGNREVVVKVMKILDEMDVKAPQVVLSTVIGELRLTNDEEFGIDYFGRINDKGLVTTNFTGVRPRAGGGTTNADGTVNGGNIFRPGIGPFTQLVSGAASGVNAYLVAGNSLLSVVHALNKTGRFRTISRPTVFTTNNKKAIIASGTEIPVPVNTLAAPANNLVGQSFNTQSSIQYKKIALQLEVVPLINSEKEVTLEILQKLDNVEGFTNVSGNDIPNVATRYIKTTVSAPNCSTIILGGLIQDRKERSENGIPLLSRIPLIGGLFRETNKVKERRELIILMRPEVTLTKLDLYRMRQKSSDRMHLGPEIDQDDCPDCPKPGDGKQFDLPAPDLPGMK
jgi:general secretion pathway protein D